MKMRNHDIIGLPVETQSGRLLGKVTDMEVDVENHVVLNYHVDAQPIVKKLLSRSGADLLIAPAQVVSITAEKMIVEDAAEGEPVDAYDSWQKTGIQPARTTGSAVQTAQRE